MFFFFKQKTAYEMRISDWSSDVCSSDLPNPCLGPLRKPPFYAVEIFAGDIGTACGIKTDEFARAISLDGDAIPGLYIVGNDMNSVMGGAYPGPGITLGPALTFGWVAGIGLAAV